MSEEIKTKIRTYVEKLDKDNLNVIDEFFAPDVVIHMAPNPDMNLEPVSYTHLTLPTILLV